MAEHRWCYRVDNLKIGPVDEREFIKQIKRGVVDDSTDVFSSTRTGGKWVVAAEVPAIKRKINRAKSKSQAARSNAANDAPTDPVPVDATSKLSSPIAANENTDADHVHHTGPRAALPRKTWIRIGIVALAGVVVSAAFIMYQEFGPAANPNSVPAISKRALKIGDATVGHWKRWDDRARLESCAVWCERTETKVHPSALMEAIKSAVENQSVLPDSYAMSNLVAVSLVRLETGHAAEVADAK